MPAWLKLLLAGGLTWGCVVIAWVVFRADSLATAASILAALAGAGAEQATGLINVGRAWRIFVPLGLIVWGLPNLMQVFGEFAPAIDTYRGETQPPRWLTWRPSPAWACALGLVGLIAVLYCNQPSEFLYFQF
ncbi:MAG: hypothetical protein BWY87_01617 [Deltaproteobacteria bacterium ADurb.Bin510]|nr:MAG: hypothetical protein BWY87_01617 [Deltaproteobacteria bacterium ADurb.Bin510]